MNEPIIHVEHLSKRYRIGEKEKLNKTFREVIAFLRDSCIDTPTTNQRKKVAIFMNDLLRRKDLEKSYKYSKGSIEFSANPYHLSDNSYTIHFFALKNHHVVVTIFRK